MNIDADRHSRRTLRRTLAVVSTLAAIALPSVLATPARSDTTPNRRVEVSDAGISIEYPRTWQRVPLTPRAIRAMQRRAARHNPSAAGAIDAAMRSALSEATRLAVFAPSLEPPIANLMVIVTDLPYPSADDLDHVKDAIAEQGFEVIGSSSLTIDGLQARRIDAARSLIADDGTTVRGQIAQVFVPNGDHTVLVNVAAGSGPEGKALIDGIVGSIRRVGRLRFG